jgi:hypothetical protein
MPFSSPDGRYHPYVPPMPKIPERKVTIGTGIRVLAEMMAGLHDKHEGGFMGLKAPIPTSTALFALLIVPILILLALLRT